MFIPFTYLIGWTAHNRWYYGARYAKGCFPKDLWFSYFTSSKQVKAFREQHGEPDVIEVRRTFLSQSDARFWEHKVLRRLNVIDSERWLNKSQADGKFICTRAHRRNSKTHVFIA